MNRKWDHPVGEFYKEYSKYRAMIQRTNKNCTNKKSIRNYLGKGIICCEDWVNSFDNFMVDMGPCPPEHELDRIDNAKGYYKENCRWATRNINQYNRNKHRGNFLKGTRFHKKNKVFTAQICIDFCSYYIGSFKTEKMAHEAYNIIALEWYGFLVKEK